MILNLFFEHLCFAFRTMKNHNGRTRLRNCARS